MDYEYLKRYVLGEFGMDLSAYKDNQIKRRLEILLTRTNTDDYKGYVQFIKKDDGERAKLLRALTVNTTEFYRDPVVFDYLKEQVFPGLLKEKERIRIWSAGSSDGPEPYTIAMILDSMAIPTQRFQIYATDIDNEVLARAKVGKYQERRLAKLPSGWRERYFREVDRGYIISDDIKNRVSFKKHDLLGKLLLGPWDVVLCRNVLIYLNREAQQNLVTKFAHLLESGGYLILGWPEYIFQPEKQGLTRVGPCTYKKNS